MFAYDSNGKPADIRSLERLFEEHLAKVGVVDTRVEIWAQPNCQVLCMWGMFQKKIKTHPASLFFYIQGPGAHYFYDWLEINKRQEGSATHNLWSYNKWIIRRAWEYRFLDLQIGQERKMRSVLGTTTIWQRMQAQLQEKRAKLFVVPMPVSPHLGWVFRSFNVHFDPLFVFLLPSAGIRSNWMINYLQENISNIVLLTDEMRTRFNYHYTFAFLSDQGKQQLSLELAAFIKGLQ